MSLGITRILLLLACTGLWVQAATAAAPAPAPPAGAEPSGVQAAAAPLSMAEQSRALERAANAVVGVRVAAIEGARSANTLGRSRLGSGVVIDDDGLVLTIGYLVLEAEQVQLVTDDSRVIPARVVAYDQATGFGLVRALLPLKLPPVPLGQARAVTDAESLMIVSGGEAGALSAARLVSRRAFAGYWEYQLDDALFTAPPRPDHSGAGLFNERGELVGIGSLLVNDAAGGERRQPGNMFVPTDLLSPILPELLARGRSQQSERAWMGVNCVETSSRVRVVRVTEDSPADVAGLEPGDEILSLDGEAVAGLSSLWKALWKGTGSSRAVQLQIDRRGEVRTVTVHTVDRAATLRRATGI